VSAAVWHDLECGSYTQDLELWLRLAGELVAPDEAVLDVGAGTGRVTLSLARAGHRVVALDLDSELLVELDRRTAGLAVESVCADARTFSLPGRAFPLIVAPMQTLQILGGRDARTAFLARAKEHLVSGGRLALAIAAADDFDEFEWHEGDASPLPDIAEFDGWSYFSQPTAVRRDGDTFVLERRREAVDPSGNRSISTDSIWLDIVSADEIQEAGVDIGLRPLAVTEIKPTAEHIGSQVVILGA
jgi:SAM-dependent methyltransferase